MKKILSLVFLTLFCISCTMNALASDLTIENNNCEDANIGALYFLLSADGCLAKDIELVSDETHSTECIPYSNTILIGTKVHEKVFRFVDEEISSNKLAGSPVYSYINDYSVEIYLYDKDTKEEWARGFVSANFRYNSDYQEAKCLSTNAGKISALDGYTVETTHRTDNKTWDVGGAYGEVNFKWGIFGINKNRNTVTITCDSDGNVKYTHTKLDQ